VKGQFIYKIINTINNKFYVGSTTNTKDRFAVHRKRLRKNVHHTKHLQAAWNKYGEKAFVFHVIEMIPPDQSLQEAEDRWLIEHVGKDYCYNSGLRSGAPWRGALKEDHPRFNKPKTEEERQAISSSLKEFYAKDITNHPRFGKTHSEETKARIKAKKLENPQRYWLGKERSEETKKKVGDSQRGKLKAPGRVISPEGMAKIRAAAEAGHYSHWEGRKHTDESRMKMGKQVVALLPDGSVREFITMNAAAQELGVFLPTLIRACKGGKPVQKGKLSGWVFSYKGEENPPPEIPEEYAHLPRSRFQAKAEGAPYYFTGIPCSHGHISPRLTRGACLVCKKEEGKKATKLLDSPSNPV
jgi:group I intron endonuclease